MNTPRRSLLALTILACTALPASAQFGGLLGGIKPSPVAGSGGGGNIDQDVKVFSDKSTVIETTLASASEAIGRAYGSELDRAKLAALHDSVRKSTDPKEASAKRAEIAQTMQAIVDQAAASKDLEQKTSAMSDQKKQFLARAVTLYLSGALQAKDLMPAGQNLLTSAAANPMNLGKLADVKEALPRLGNAVAFAGASVPKLVMALRGANVKVVEPKSSVEAAAGISEADIAANS